MKPVPEIAEQRAWPTTDRIGDVARATEGGVQADEGERERHDT
jgi:hypothetical protein